jgi:hypothetical protein
LWEFHYIFLNHPWLAHFAFCLITLSNPTFENLGVEVEHSMHVLSLLVGRLKDTQIVSLCERLRSQVVTLISSLLNWICEYLSSRGSWAKLGETAWFGSLHLGFI